MNLFISFLSLQLPDRFDRQPPDSNQLFALQCAPVMKNFIFALALCLCVTGCGEKPAPQKKSAESEGGKAAAGGGVAIADASRQFLTIEALAPSSGATERS